MSFDFCYFSLELFLSPDVAIVGAPFFATEKKVRLAIAGFAFIENA
jgi:hypothetical protein